MMKLMWIKHSLLAAAAPAMVLVNALLPLTAAPTPVLLQPLSLAETLVDSEPKTLNQALKQMPMVLPTAAQASITWQDGRYVLEFFHALNAAAQTPDLMLMLDMDAQPQGTYGPRRDRAVMLGPLHPVAGQQRYPIPAAVDVNQYRSVAIWCPELNAVLGYLPVSVDG